ncbi:MAG: amidohydrolase, partial [Pseudomonadota bacterium]
MDRYDIAQVYAIHNVPGLEFGSIYTTPGPIMAAVDTFTINVKGRGGHGAMPQDTVDPVVAACSMVQAIQTIVSRNHNTANELVVSVTQIHAGTVNNVIPETAMINGTVRTFDPEVQAMVKARMHDIVAGQAASFGVEATLDYESGYPATVNAAAETAFAADVARDVVGKDKVTDDFQKVAGAEDFAYMLQSRPGSYLFLGAGEGHGLHHPQYDYNDEISPIGASFLARLVETAQPVAR